MTPTERLIATAYFSDWLRERFGFGLEDPKAPYLLESFLNGTLIILWRRKDQSS